MYSVCVRRARDGPSSVNNQQWTDHYLLAYAERGPVHCWGSVVQPFLTMVVGVFALFVVGCAPVEHRQQLSETVGQVTTVPAGGTIATINKQKDLPNIFGRADIYGRKVDTGFIKIIYQGRGNDGSALIEQVDVDVHSNASVFTRMPAMSGANSQVTVTGSGNGAVMGQGTSGAWSVAPQVEQNIVLPPTGARFAVPKGKTLTLPTGQTIEFLDVEPYQLTYRILDNKGQPPGQ